MPTAPSTSTASTAPRTAAQAGAPAWATPGYFHALQNKSSSSTSPTALTGGSLLATRLGAMTAKAPAATPTTTAASTAPHRNAGLALLAQAGHAVGVLAGRPLTAAEISAAPRALHLTRPEHVESILTSGLRPTTGVFKNLTTWCRKAVYMFASEPNALQKFTNFSLQQHKTTAVIEIDLQKLDPTKLYKRLVDDAIIYVATDPIPASALRLRSSGT